MKKRKATAPKGKALFIRNPRARELADLLSKRLGVTIGEAVILALQDKIREMPRPINRAKIAEIQAMAAVLPVLDSRSMDEILGYDEFGLPS